MFTCDVHLFLHVKTFVQMANQHVKMCENMELTHVLFPRLEILIPISPKKADLI